MVAVIRAIGSLHSVFVSGWMYMCRCQDFSTAIASDAAAFLYVCLLFYVCARMCVRARARVCVCVCVCVCVGVCECVWLVYF